MIRKTFISNFTEVFGFKGLFRVKTSEFPDGGGVNQIGTFIFKGVIYIKPDPVCTKYNNCRNYNSD